MKRRALWLLLVVLFGVTWAIRPALAQGWSQTFDFTVSDGGWVSDSSILAGASYTAGVGWDSIGGSGGRVIDIARSFTAVQVTQVDVHYTFDSAPARGHFHVSYGGATGNCAEVFTAGSFTCSVIMTYSSVTNIVVYAGNGTSSGVGQGATYRVTSITVYGTVANPFPTATATLTPSLTPTATFTPTLTVTPTGTIQAGFLPTIDQRPRCTSTPAPSETARPGGILAGNNPAGFSVFEGVSPEDTLTPVYLGTKVGYVAARSAGDCASDTAVGAAGARKFDVGFDAVCGEDLGGGVGFGNDAEPPVIPVGCTKKRDCYTVIPAIDLAPVATALPSGISSSQTRFTIEETKICVMYRRLSLIVAGVDLTSLITLLLGALSIFSIVNTIRWSP